jgi:hypothetical protein
MDPERTVYVDMDDVLCETCRGLITLLRDEFAGAAVYEEVDDFDLGNSFDLDPPALEAFLARAHQPDVLAGLAPIAGARETLADWSRRGFAIAIMTGRPPSTRAATEAWLDRHGIVRDSLRFVDKYGRFGAEAATEGTLDLDDLRGMRFRLAIEDSPATASFLAAHGVAPVALLDRPWNRREEGAGIRRVSGWEELAKRGL